MRQIDNQRSTLMKKYTYIVEETGETLSQIATHSLGARILLKQDGARGRLLLESEEEVTVRKATVNADAVGWGGDAVATVRQYLPGNYSANKDGDVITIMGVDNAGWTLDGYVIPRLASGMIYATEVK